MEHLKSAVGVEVFANVDGMETSGFISFYILILASYAVIQGLKDVITRHS